MTFWIRSLLCSAAALIFCLFVVVMYHCNMLVSFSPTGEEMVLYWLWGFCHPLLLQLFGGSLKRGLGGCYMHQYTKTLK